MAGLKVVPVGCDQDGNIDVADLRTKSEAHAKDLAALMVTYPSTHGVFEETIKEICDIVHAFGGSISAEHGVGVMKREEILRYKSAAEVETMRALKRLLDPNNILNPGKVVSV